MKRVTQNSHVSSRTQTHPFLPSHDHQKFPFSFLPFLQFPCFPGVCPPFLCSFSPRWSSFLSLRSIFALPFAAVLPSDVCSPPPSLLFPTALELLSLETVATRSFFPALGPAGPRNQSVAHQRPGSPLSLLPWNLGKFPGGPLAHTCHESAQPHEFSRFLMGSCSQGHVDVFICSAIAFLLRERGLSLFSFPFCFVFFSFLNQAAWSPGRLSTGSAHSAVFTLRSSLLSIFKVSLFGPDLSQPPTPLVFLGRFALYCPV